MKFSALRVLSLMLPLAGSLARADNLIQNASFEEPKIEGKVAATAGGSPATPETGTTWTHFQSMDRTKKVTVGMTNEVARTGKQAIYVQFDAAAKTKEALLMSDLIPVKAEENYRVSIWGRIDRQRPLTLDQGRPYMVLEVEFYPADQASRIGDTEYRTQMIPGVADHLLFLSTRWSEYFAAFKAPVGAEFMKVTFDWFSPKHEEAADGIIYFDDAAVEGVAGTPVPADSGAVAPADETAGTGEGAGATVSPAAKK